MNTKKLLLIILFFIVFLLYRIFSYPVNSNLTFVQEIISTRLMCELSFGSKLFGDYRQSYRSLCYSHAASQGDFWACYQNHDPSQCLVSVSLNKEAIFCNKLDENINKKCLKQLFDYYGDKVLGFSNFYKIAKAKSIVLDNNQQLLLVKNEIVKNINGQLVKEDKRCVTVNAGINCTVEGYLPFDCKNGELPTRITGKGVNHKLGDPIIFLNGCTNLPENKVKVDTLQID